MSKIYKILTEEEWQTSKSLGFINTDLDKEDGFIHCSTAKQLALTLHLYFKEEKSLVYRRALSLATGLCTRSKHRW